MHYTIYEPIATNEVWNTAGRAIFLHLVLLSRGENPANHPVFLPLALRSG
jgi:hypothetical protein